MLNLKIDIILSIPKDKLVEIIRAVENSDLEVIYANSNQQIKNEIESVLSARAVELLRELSAPLTNAEPRLIEHSAKNLMFVVSKLYQPN
ncbi:MAG: hypothetical protein H7Z71_05585 [Moraxellaceae bacterium]|nr:hypothetical protein [Pseudobdellovibrionaceae bacterium]